MLGTFLTWMAERQSQVFVVATANDIATLPPELVRKGRFDEIFFVDLPSAAARAAILRIHLRKRGQDVARFDLPALAESTDGFSGAELEQCVVAALFTAFSKRTQLTTALLQREIRDTQPLSVTMAEKIEQLRTWSEGRVRSAH